jgi:hypothetical protein
MHETMRRVASRRRILTMSALFALLGVACVDIAKPPTAPSYGFIRVIVLSTGGDLDLDGYSIVFDTQSPVTLAVNGATVANITSSYYTGSGAHAVTLGGVAANCAVKGAAVRSVSVVVGEVTDVTFEVLCAATGIAITTLTTGLDSPTNLRLVLDNKAAQTISANGSLTIGRLAAGVHTLTLLTPNHCTIVVGGFGQIDVDVTAKTLVSKTFEVTCAALTRLDEIAFVHDSIENGSVVEWIAAVKPDGTGSLLLTRGRAPTWSPSSTQLAFSTSNCDDDYYYYYYGPGCSGGLVAMDPETGETSFVASGYAVFDPSWARTGDAIAFGTIGAQKDVQELVAYRFTAPSFAPLAITGPRSKEEPSFSPDATRIAFVCRWAVNTDLCTVSATGGVPERLTDDAEIDLHPAWSPDGSRIAFARTPSGGTSPQIVLIDVATKQRTVITTGTDPAWSPDGSKLVFAGGDGLFVIGADGSNRTRLTTGPDHAPAWRP